MLGDDKELKLTKFNLLLTKAGKYSEWISSRLENSLSNIQSAKPSSTEPLRKKMKRSSMNELCGMIQLPSNNDKLKVSSRQPESVTGCVMREYQLEGMEWLISLYENGMNGILADQMGLGKTLQTISFLAYLRENQVNGPILIVAPLSTLSNWVSEVHRFTPSIPVLLYHGSKQERLEMREKYMQPGQSDYPWIVTSYDLCMNDKRFLQKLEYRYLVIDEGHRLKNLNCKLIRDLKSFTTDNRLLLTGTPLQNNLVELWSLLNFLMPMIFDTLDNFLEWFNFDSMDADSIIEKEQQESIVSNLHNILKPFLLRRIKSDVALDLPPKKEHIVYCNLTRKQQALYKAALEGIQELKNAIDEHDSSEIVLLDDDGWFDSDISAPPKPAPKVNVKLQNIVMQLKKICNHPFLFTPNEQNDNLERHSGKLLILSRLVPELLKRKHKMLIFCQMTRMMDILHDWCDLKGWSVCRIDGSTSLNERKEQISDFNDPNVSIFLLSTRAGGLGINLTAADTVILYDSDWNPQMDLQAIDRVHRIGQIKPVAVYRLVTRDSVEETILERANEKRKLEQMIIHKDHFKGSKMYYQSSFKVNDLAQVLKRQQEQCVVVDKSVISASDLKQLMNRQ